MNQRAKTYLDNVLTEEIKKDMSMRNWETNGNDPTIKQMGEERVRKEVERRINEASTMKDFNKYTIDEHERQRMTFQEE